MVPAQAIGVAVAVPTFVARADDGGDRPECRSGAEDPLSEHGVLADEAPLLGIERAGLGQDRLGKTDLADVVSAAARASSSSSSPARPSRRPTGSASRATPSARGGRSMVFTDDLEEDVVGLLSRAGKTPVLRAYMRSSASWSDSRPCGPRGGGGRCRMTRSMQRSRRAPRGRERLETPWRRDRRASRHQDENSSPPSR